MAKGMIFDIKEFTVHDGPGIRTTVFFKGCPMRCIWCHNPEGLEKKRTLMVSKNGCVSCGKCRIPCTHPECQEFGRCLKVCPQGLVRAVGEEREAGELAAYLKKQALSFQSGITLSGGEPLMQQEFLLELLDGLKGTDTAVETSGYASGEVFEEVMKRAGRIYLDIKHMNRQKHIILTGVDNGPVQRNLERLLESDRDYVIRMPWMKGCNDDRENIIALAKKLKMAKKSVRLEILPYNSFAGAKYQMAGMKFPLDGREMEGYKIEIPRKLYRECNVQFRIL